MKHLKHAIEDQEGLDADEMSFVTVSNISVEDSTLVKSVIAPGTNPPCSLVLLTGGEPPKPSSQRSNGPGCQERERPQSSQTITADAPQLLSAGGEGDTAAAAADPTPAPAVVAFQGASHTLGSTSVGAEEGRREDPRAKMLAAAEARARALQGGE
ncbi:hypothetical protein T484DRAFT_1750203 [Baffinella frigidus]|nr:hypothetical protein T484DRAFT_1750203 [Cryptophyta sp. CCMP2293]